MLFPHVAVEETHWWKIPRNMKWMEINCEMCYFCFEHCLRITSALEKQLISKTEDEPKRKKESSMGRLLDPNQRHKMKSLRFFFWLEVYTDPVGFFVLLPQVCLAAWTSMKQVTMRTTWRRSGYDLCRPAPTPDPTLLPVAKTLLWADVRRRL